MTTTPGPNDLTTVAAVQAYLTELPASDLGLIQSLVSNASAFIQTYTSRTFVSGTYTEVRDGNGRDSIALFNGPVASVTSVTIDNQSIPESPGWPQPGYSMDESCIWLRNYWFRRGRGNVTIVYTAGYTSIPGDLAQACIELVAYKYKLRDKTGTVTEVMMNQTTSYSQKDMPASVKTVLDSYRRYFYVFDVTITGREQIVAKLGQADTGIRAALRLAIQTITVDLQSKVQEKLSGPVLKARSGRLRNSIATKVDEDPAQITGTVSAKTPYAAIQEYGGTTRAHLIQARDANSLAFMIGGKMVFAKSVHHPGSNIPERSYLRSTLAENAASVSDQLRHAVQQAIYDQGFAE